MKVLITIVLFTTLLAGTLVNVASSGTTSISQISNGVMLRGCGDDWSISNGLIQNLNKYPVRIRRVRQGRGEFTEAIDLLDPRAKLSIREITNQHGFYIYTIDGVMVGWLSGKCPY